MKNRIYLWILFLVVLQSCKSTSESNDVLLSKFSTELISLYCRDMGVSVSSEPSKEIILISSSDTSYYYLSIFANTPSEHEFFRNDFWGATESNGMITRVFGELNPMFFSSIGVSCSASPCDYNKFEYDPDVWVICFNKDGSLCKMRTHKVTNGQDISDIQKLADNYFEVSKTTPKDVFGVGEVEVEPKFAQGEESLQAIINNNFSKKYIKSLTKTLIVVHIVVDENGLGTFKKVAKSSSNSDIDNEAIRVSKIICQYKFIPASHRGDKVKAVFPVFFYKK